MREILFRGKRLDNGEWVYGNLSIRIDGETTIYDRPSGNGLVCSVGRCVIPESVGQYTGLCENGKNGKKIFEGDIVKCRHHWHLRVYPRDGINEKEYFFAQKIRGAYGKSVDNEGMMLPCDKYYYFRNYAVEYYAPNGGFRIRNGGQFSALTQNNIYNRNLEIIGNIHDNPELLKGADDENR